MASKRRYNHYPKQSKQYVPYNAKVNLDSPSNIPPLNTTSFESIESNTSFIDKITWPIEPLSYRNIDDNEDDDANESLLSSVDTNELLISPHSNLHHLSITHQPSIYSDNNDIFEELPALPIKKKKSKLKTYIPAVSSYFSNKYYDSMTVDDSIINDNVILPLPSITKRKSMPHQTKSGVRYIIKTNPNKLSKTPNITNVNKLKKRRKNNKKKKERIAPQIDPLDTHSESPIPPIPTIDLDHDSTTFEYDYDSDVQPKPDSYKVQTFALTKENIDRLNNDTDSTSTDGYDALKSLEQIGKELREISIVNVEKTDTKINTEYCDGLSSTEFDLSSKYTPPTTESTIPHSIEVSSTKYDVKYDAKYDKRYKLNKIKQKKRKRKIKPYINDADDDDILINDVVNDDALYKEDDVIAYEEEKEMDFKSTIYGNNIMINDRNSANTTKTETYENSQELENQLNFIHKNERSNCKRSKDIRSHHVRYKDNGSSTDVICIGEDTDDEDKDDDMPQIHHMEWKKRENHSLCLNMWSNTFHFISIISHLSQTYVYFIYYKFGGITYELMCCAMLTLIIFLIYIGIMIKNSSYRYEYIVNSVRKQRVWMIRCLTVSCIINCTHYLLQFVIYMYLWIVIRNWSLWSVFDKYEVYTLVNIILLQCMSLSMTLLNIITYFWETKHYHSQSLSFRVLSLYLDIMRILFLLYMFWNLSDNIISSFYYLYFYIEYWLLFILLITIRYVLIFFNWNPLYRSFGCFRFVLYFIYSLIEPIFRFIVIQLFPHCGVYYMIHNIGTGAFDHYIGKQFISIKKAICAPTMTDKDHNFYCSTGLRHIQLLEIFEFIENGVYQYMDKIDVKQELLRRILTINYQLLMDDDTWRASALDEDQQLSNLNNAILYEFHKMVQMAIYPIQRDDNSLDSSSNDSNYNIDIFENKCISKSTIFMEWFIHNDLMSNLHFEWNNSFVVNHALFTTFFCKYIVTLFYIFTRITNICWLYFMINNCILYLFNTNHKSIMLDDTKWLLMYIFAAILLFQVFAHIMLIVFAINAYKFERNIWFLLPMANAQYNHKLLNPHRYEKDDDDKGKLYDRYSTDNSISSTIKSAVNLYESLCYKHIVSNNLYERMGFDVGAVIMAYLGDGVNVKHIQEQKFKINV